MSRRISKEEQRYQLSKTYSFKDLERYSMIKDQEINKLNKTIADLVEMKNRMQDIVKKHNA